MLAFSPTAVRLNPPRNELEPMRAMVLDVRQFRNTVQIVFGEPPLTAVAEVPLHEFRPSAIKKGDLVSFSIATAWVVDAAS